jgi:Flp pilus assembly protein TadD
LHRTTTALVVLTLLAACGNSGGLGASAASRNSPFGADARGDAVDGLLVGHRLMEAGEHELALRAYFRAAADDGITADVLSAIGAANLALGRLGQAENILRRAVATDGENVPALNNLGVVLMERGNFGEARTIFQRAYALDSGQSDSIRKNLQLAIAQSESAVYDPNAVEGGYELVRQERGRYVLLTKL